MGKAFTKTVKYSGYIIPFVLTILVAGLNLYYFSGESKPDQSLAAKILAERTYLNPRLAEYNTRLSGDEQNRVVQTNQPQVDSENFFINTAQAAGLEDQEKGERKPFEYEVEGGDTLSSIAVKYNLKLDTILWANNLTAKSIIKPGQKITLLPTDGVLHTISKGDTVSAIASAYKADSAKVLEFNGITDAAKIHAGEVLIIPDGKPLPPPPKAPSRRSSDTLAKGDNIIAEAVGRLVWPTTHKNMSRGYSASHRGLDIANGGKPDIIAAQSGKVEFSGTDGDWGNTILIRGDNGLVTRYSHNSENFVRVGEEVKAGDIIGKVGNTGNVIGKTGLHLDFRVYKKGVSINPAGMF